MLQHGLARAEGTGHAEGAALGDRQEGVDAADLGHQRLVGTQTLLIAADGLLDRPGKDHAQRLLLARAVFQHRNGGADVIDALFLHALYAPALVLEVEGRHDEVRELPLRHAADRVAREHGVAGLDAGGELPFLIGDGVKVYAALEEEAALLGKLRQRILQAVVHLRQKAGAELDAQKLAGQLDLVADLNAVGHFIDLHTHGVAADADDLALEAVIADLDEADFVFPHGAREPRRNEVAVDSSHIACHFLHFVSPVFL